jgi:trimethylamine:corrinoid methyltransferase-like protein
MRQQLSEVHGDVNLSLGMFSETDRKFIEWLAERLVTDLGMPRSRMPEAVEVMKAAGVQLNYKHAEMKVDFDFDEWGGYIRPHLHVGKYLHDLMPL